MTLHTPASQEGLDVFTPGHGLASILLASVRSQVLPGALSGALGRLWRSKGDSRGTPGTVQDDPKTLLEHCRVPRGVPKGFRDRF